MDVTYQSWNMFNYLDVTYLIYRIRYNYLDVTYLSKTRLLIGMWLIYENIFNSLDVTHLPKTCLIIWKYGYFYCRLFWLLICRKCSSIFYNKNKTCVTFCVFSVLLFFALLQIKILDKWRDPELVARGGRQSYFQQNGSQ